ncbi:hypothetical protein LOC71_00140 [Rhodopirellula sp. JC740]|uniref:Uncharacterized protein n=1 Tax=Rhodopirellula halodulae TaxID=2894198 RepID=A0ABS8NAS0_9BACT|nr:hypothetical protein [Rhodopirellula sp. JC740]MCC9640665.1 hypothetical protein [Rhodopirellula sp. JC740]
MTPVHPGDRSSATTLRKQEAIEQSMCFGRSIRWPVARVAGVEVSVAMSLPLGIFAAIAIGISAYLADANGTTDWQTHVHWMGWLLSFWIAGLALQTSIAIWQQRGANILRGACIVTVAGVWTAPSGRPHSISIAGVLMTWSLCMLSLGVGSLALIAISLLFGEATPERSPLVWLDDPWAAAAWLWCLQGLWNLTPLPQSLGRVGWSLVIALFGGGPQNDPRVCLRSMRAWVIASALLILVGGNWILHTTGIMGQPGGMAWPAVAGVVALSLWLFTSSGNADLTAIYESIVRRAEYTEVGEINPIGRLRGKFGPAATWRRYRTTRENRRQEQRLRDALQKERQEANDAARVDAILQRLHQDGVESLSADELELLQRVSDALKNERRNLQSEEGENA